MGWSCSWSTVCTQTHKGTRGNILVVRAHWVITSTIHTGAGRYTGRNVCGSESDPWNRLWKAKTRTKIGHIDLGDLFFYSMVLPKCLSSSDHAHLSLWFKGPSLQSSSNASTRRRPLLTEAAAAVVERTNKMAVLQPSPGGAVPYENTHKLLWSL